MGVARGLRQRMLLPQAPGRGKAAGVVTQIAKSTLIYPKS